MIRADRAISSSCGSSRYGSGGEGDEPEFVTGISRSGKRIRQDGGAMNVVASADPAARAPVLDSPEDASEGTLEGTTAPDAVDVMPAVKSADDVFGARPLGALAFHERHLLAGLQCIELHAIASRHVEEQILATGRLDETKTLVGDSLDSAFAHLDSYLC